MFSLSFSSSNDLNVWDPMRAHYLRSRYYDIRTGYTSAGPPPEFESMDHMYIFVWRLPPLKEKFLREALWTKYKGLGQIAQMDIHTTLVSKQ